MVVSSERGTLKDVLHNETVELETEMVVAMMKDVASALKYLHQLEPPILDKEITSSHIVLNADYGAQLIHVHLAMVSSKLLHALLEMQGCLFNIDCTSMQLWSHCKPMTTSRCSRVLF